MKKDYNILLILTDQLNYKYLSCYGNKYIRTPNLQKLADQSLVFNNMYCTSPVCLPARASITTGEYSEVVGGAGNYFRLRTDVKTIPDYLKSRGYTTGVFGKLHWNPYEWEYSRYDEVFESAHHTSLWLWDNAYTKYIKKYYADRGFNYKEEIPDVMGHLNPEGEYNTDYLVGTSNMPYDISPSKYLADRTIDFIDKHKNEKFFAYYSPIEPHHPYFPCKDFSGLYSDMIDDIKSDVVITDFEMKESIKDDHEYIKTRINTKNFDRIIDSYMGLITELDTSIGYLLSYLEDNGLMENTILLFTSDHGDMMGDFGLIFKDRMYDSSAKVPFLLYHPEYKKHRQVDMLATHLDILPTLLELSGQDTESGHLPGCSLIPYLKDNQHKNHEKIFCVELKIAKGDKDKIEKHKKAEKNELVFQQEKEHMYAKVMVRTDRYKYFKEGFGKELTSEELYDMIHDPGELHNLVQDEKFNAVKNELSRCIDNFWLVEYEYLKKEY